MTEQSMIDLPDYDSAPAPEGLDGEDDAKKHVFATYSNNQLRAMYEKASPGFTEELWKGYAADNRAIVEQHRGFWGLDVSQGWEEKAWNVPSDQSYEIINREQYEHAMAQVPDKESQEEMEGRPTGPEGPEGCSSGPEGEACCAGEEETKEEQKAEQN